MRSARTLDKNKNLGKWLNEPLTVELTDDGLRWKVSSWGETTTKYLALGETVEDGLHTYVCKVSSWGETTTKYLALGETVEDGLHTYVCIDTHRALILPSDRIPKDQIGAFVE